jgi:hypothetical protein
MESKLLRRMREEREERIAAFRRLSLQERWRVLRTNLRMMRKLRDAGRQLLLSKQQQPPSREP